MERQAIGKIIHFYPKISVAVVELSKQLKVGDRIAVEGKANSFEQSVESMQVEHKNVEKAKAGDSIGLKVADHVKEGDTVYKLV